MSPMANLYLMPVLRQIAVDVREDVTWSSRLGASRSQREWIPRAKAAIEVRGFAGANALDAAGSKVISRGSGLVKRKYKAEEK